MSKPIKVLLGIDEEYTHQAIFDCFKNRKEYEIILYDQNDKIQKKHAANLNYDVYWLEYEYLDFESLIQNSNDTKLMFNSYCIRKGLIRKAHIAYYLKKFLLKNSNSTLAKNVPETCIFELDYIDYLDEALNEAFEVELELKENEKRLEENIKTKKFILKSSMTNKGAEILIFDRRKQLEEFFQNRIDYLDENDENYDGSLDLREWVIQQYIDNPLLLPCYQKRKFHLRVYVIAVGNLNVYVYENILALFCLKSYNELDLEHKNLMSHITNTCFQYDATCSEDSKIKFNESDCIKEFWSLVFDETNKERNKTLKNHIFDQIKSVVASVFECLSCEKIVFQPLENAFELYGFDFLIDSNYNVFFLEANAFPDFKRKHKLIFYYCILTFVLLFFFLFNIRNRK
jgi:tubulin---tyrosine ligase